MSTDLTWRAKRLREAFDRSFAEPLERATPPTTDLLGVRLAGEPYAVRLSEAGAIFVDRHVAPLPSPDPQVLGLVSLRGALHTVFDLRARLKKSTALSPRWLITHRDGAVAFAFDGFDGLLRVETASIVSAVTAEPGVDELNLGPPRRPVVNLNRKGRE
jgi:chemotaxis signal transduction protein